MSNTLSYTIARSLMWLKTLGEQVDTGHWQGVETAGKPDMVTKEFLNMTLQAPIPRTMKELAQECRPNLPWAEDHFQERVGRVPSNPGEEYKNWPWWRGQDDSTRTNPKCDACFGSGFEGGSMSAGSCKSCGGSGLHKDRKPVFSHTYQERFWPKRANPSYEMFIAAPKQFKNREGIRYEYGDLDDVVNLLRQHPYTRQATFPIFFPEDTGAVHGGRIPCTLHYHFMLRNSRLHLWYPIRSCDAVRHFRDDLYMAGRLCQWVLDELRDGDNDFEHQDLWEDAQPGNLYFTAYSFHVHMGDYHRLVGGERQ